jgi:hypothetical protein
MRHIWGNRAVLADMARLCACGHRNYEHGLWIDSMCRWDCTCPNFFVGARVRLGSKWAP